MSCSPSPWPELFCVLSLLAGCGGAAIRGGHATTEESLRHTSRVLSFVVSDCRDAHEAPTAARSARVDIVRLGSGEAALVEYRPGYDALVVQNSFIDGSVQIFQAIVEASGEKPLLHEFRIPEPAASGGEVRVSDRFTEEPLSSGGFRARGQGLVSHCALSLAEPSQSH
jgi:hypothetical protein